MLWLTTALHGDERDEREAFIRACAQGERPTGILAQGAIRQIGASDNRSVV